MKHGLKLAVIATMVTAVGIVGPVATSAEAAPTAIANGGFVPATFIPGCFASTYCFAS